MSIDINKTDVMEEDSNVTYETSLFEIVRDFKLETMYGPEGWEKRKVVCSDVSRPGLALSGFLDCFDPLRLELLGKAEYEYMASLPLDVRREKYEAVFALNIPAIIITWGLPVLDGLVDAAKKYGIPVFRTIESTTDIHHALISQLSVVLAPRITRHGVLVEVYGEGVLILGDSGIGKSETAIELVKRGHRLIADDAVELKKVSSKTIVGSAPEVLRHFTELRGIGIVDVQRTFGIGSVKETEKINMVLKLEPWDKDKFYDRIGLETQTTNILGIEIATTTIPVSSGRNLAVIIEVAAMNNKQRRLGYNTAEKFTERLTEFMLNGKGVPLF